MLPSLAQQVDVCVCVCDMKNSLTAVERRDVCRTAATSSAATERPNRCLYSDTVNADNTSSPAAFRPSDVVTSAAASPPNDDQPDNTPPCGERRQQSSDDDVQGQRSRTAGRGRSWKELAQVVDRLFFWVMLTAMTSSTMIVLLAPAYKHYLSAQH